MFKFSENLPEVSEIALGCMRYNSMTEKEIGYLVDTALDAGINFFDHADIYGGGQCEELFGNALTPERRSRMVLQSKCAIRPGKCYDFSKEHILESVEGSLKRLKTDHLDVLLLHRPDALMEPSEVAEAFESLRASGKVLSFGVSNMNPGQIEYLSAAVGKISADQIQMSIAHCPAIDAGINFNIASDASCMRDGNILDYSRMKDITIQAWSPFQYGMFKGVFIGSEEYPKLNEVLTRLAKKYDTTENGIAAAWLLRIPGKMQVIIGSTNVQRILDCQKAAAIKLEREDWYELYLSAGKILP